MAEVRIVSNPNIFGGKPVIEDTRISVELIIDCLAAGWTLDMILEEYPHLTREQVLAALEFAKETPACLI